MEKIDHIKKLIRFRDIKKSIQFLDIKNRFFDIKKWISLNQNMKFWYQEIGFISWYKKSIFLYQEI